MKKSVKAAALILAVTMTLTACRGSSAPNGGYAVYSKAEVTQVENKSYELDGREGEYTGDWKGNRPEGTGTLFISEDEYYSGTWNNGYISGQAEMKKVGDDGIIKQYTGECAYNQPSGQGKLVIGEEGDETRTIIEGDFNDISTLMFFTIDEVGKLLDIGGIYNGEYISYVNNADVQGMSYLFDRGRLTWGATFKSRNGEYIGQVNEEGIPNGYGYYEEVYELNQGLVQTPTSYTYQALGSWKDGKLDGYYTSIMVGSGMTYDYKRDFWGRTKKTEHKYTTTSRYEGQAMGDESVGNYRSFECYDNDPRDPGDGYIITTMNYDTNIKMVEKHLFDGTHSYEWRHMTSSTKSDEGEYAKYDSNWNMTIHKIQQNGEWITLQNLEKDLAEARNRMLEKGGKILVGGVVAFGVIYGLGGGWGNAETNPAMKYVQKTKDYYRASTEDYQSSMAKKEELLEEARRIREQANGESGYRRNSLMDQADALEREAWSYHRSLF